MNSALFFNMKTCEFKTNQLFICTADQYLNHYIGFSFIYVHGIIY